MQQKQQFTLRYLVLLITLISVILAIVLALEPIWRLVLAVSGVTLAISWACLLAADKTVRSVRRWILIAISITSAWMLWLGLHPGMYDMAGPFLAIMLWGGLLFGCLVIAFASSSVSGTVAPAITTTEERALLIIPLVTTLLLAFQIPLRLGAATAIPTLESTISGRDAARTVEQQRCGLYTVRLPGRRRGRTSEQVYFVLADDWESAFVYSPSGIDDISYNAGSKGHLFGNWYWIKED